MEFYLFFNISFFLLKHVKDLLPKGVIILNFVAMCFQFRDGSPKKVSIRTIVASQKWHFWKEFGP